MAYEPGREGKSEVNPNDRLSALIAGLEQIVANFTGGSAICGHAERLPIPKFRKPDFLSGPLFRTGPVNRDYARGH